MACKRKWHIFQAKNFMAKYFSSCSVCQIFHVSFHFGLIWVFLKMLPGPNWEKHPYFKLLAAGVSVTCRNGVASVSLHVSWMVMEKGVRIVPQPSNTGGKEVTLRRVWVFLPTCGSSHQRFVSG